MLAYKKTRIICLAWIFLLYITRNRIIRSIDYLFYSWQYDEIDEHIFKEISYSRNQVHKVADGRVNGVLLGLVRNQELEGLKRSIKQLEETFNHKKYPYVFLNDEEFTLEFKEEIRKMVDVVEFGIIPREHWSVPAWIDNSRFRQRLKDLKSTVSYGGLESYRHMCRFNSGFFYKHKLLDKYDYYWRIEPDVDFYCKLNYDPFQVMKASKKKYGFNVLAKEEMKTVDGLWKATLDFMEEFDITPKPLLKIFQSDGTKEYNGLHFWSNFEIGDLNWLRGKEYNDYFEFLDKRGGFFYQRWGDAPVHSLAVGMFLNIEEIHYFGDIGYRHDDVKTCPELVNYPNLDLDCDDRCYLGDKRFDWVYRGIWGPIALNGFRQMQELRNHSTTRQKQ